MSHRVQIECNDSPLVELLIDELRHDFALERTSLDAPNESSHREAVTAIILASAGATLAVARAVVILVRGLSRGVEVHVADGATRITAHEDLPRGTAIIRRMPGSDVELVDLAAMAAPSARDRVAKVLNSPSGDKADQRPATEGGASPGEATGKS